MIKHDTGMGDLVDCPSLCFSKNSVLRGRDVAFKMGEYYNKNGIKKKLIYKIEKEEASGK